MDKTRWSLCYVAAYLSTSGLMLLFFPTLALKLFFSNGDYGTIFPRVAGTLIIGLAIIVIQIIRLRIEALYPTTLGVRVVFLACWGVFYAMTRDPFFLALIGIVGLGFVMTSISYFLDRQASKQATE